MGEFAPIPQGSSPQVLHPSLWHLLDIPNTTSNLAHLWIRFRQQKAQLLWTRWIVPHPSFVSNLSTCLGGKPTWLGRHILKRPIFLLVIWTSGRIDCAPHQDVANSQAFLVWYRLFSPLYKVVQIGFLRTNFFSMEKTTMFRAFKFRNDWTQVVYKIGHSGKNLSSLSGRLGRPNKIKYC